MAGLESGDQLRLWMIIPFVLISVLLGPLMWRVVLPGPTAPEVEWRALPFAVAGSLLWGFVLVEYVIPLV